MGRLEDGMIVMVPFVLPGEVVTIRELKRFSGYIQAELLHIERSNPKRQAPFCPHYKTCGGCDLQHTSYQNQLTIKEEIVGESLRRNGIEPQEAVSIALPSPLIRGYRFTVRLHLDRNGALGFYRRGSHDIVEINGCPLVTPALNNTIRQLQQTRLTRELAAFSNQLELSCSPLGAELCATLHLAGKQQPAKSFLERLLSESEIKSIALTFRRKTSFFPGILPLQQQFSPAALRYTLSWDSRCFFQVNPEQNRQLVALALRHTGDLSGRKVLDLFCGMGNFSIPFARSGAEVTGVEHNRPAIEAARKNVGSEGTDNSKFIVADVGNYLQGIKKQRKKERFDLVLLDPPRQGLGKTTSLLPATGARKIIYISCDPATLSRDLKSLGGLGYRLRNITPLDMFPHTHHIESLAVLEKN